MGANLLMRLRTQQKLLYLIRQHVSTDKHLPHINDASDSLKLCHEGESTRTVTGACTSPELHLGETVSSGRVVDVYL